MAAVQLMQVALTHVDAISRIAEHHYTGAFFESANVLCRVAFEAAVTAYWLAERDDWKDRESRWLRWVKKEEAHRTKVAKEMASVSPQMELRLQGEVDALRHRRTQIGILLIREYVSAGSIESEVRQRIEKSSVPSFRNILMETDLGEDRYIVYSLLSHSTHIGPSSAGSSLRVEGSTVTSRFTHGPSEWTIAFEVASWSVAAASQKVLRLCGGRELDLHQIVDEHDLMLRATRALNNAYGI